MKDRKACREENRNEDEYQNKLDFSRGSNASSFAHMMVI